jgi:hypothetical protein
MPVFVYILVRKAYAYIQYDLIGHAMNDYLTLLKIRYRIISDSESWKD